MINNLLLGRQGGGSPPPIVGTISTSWSGGTISVAIEGSSWPGGKPSNGLIYEVYNDGVFYSVSAANMTETNINIPISYEGGYNISCKAVDASGQKSAMSNYSYVYVSDLTPPDIVYNSVTYSGGQIHITVTTSDPSGVYLTMLRAVFGQPGNVDLRLFEIVYAGGTITFNKTTTQYSRYSILMMAYDNYNNEQMLWKDVTI